MNPPFGTATLVLGPEGLLAERATQILVDEAARTRSDVFVTRVPALELDRGRLADLAGGSLFSTAAMAVIEQLAELPADLADELVALAAAPGDDLALVLVHPGGQKGKALLDRLRKAGVTRIDVPQVKPWELPQFVTAEVRRRGGRIERGAAEALVSAVGSDLRSVAAAVAQLLADTEAATISRESVGRYFAGRAETSGFAVADHCMDGNREAALASLGWALQTGVAPVLLTSAVASALRNLGKYQGAVDERLRGPELARRIGVPPWKVKDLARQAKGWTAADLGAAIELAATADAQVKGAAGDAGYALELLVLRVIALRGRRRAGAAS